MVRLSLAFALAAGWATADEAPYYRVSAEDLACILAHLETYRAMGDPAFVVTGNCPPQSGDSLLSTLTNEVPTVTLQEGDALDGFVALTSGQMECLSGLTLPEGATVVRYYPDACRIEAEQ
ncbi:hypothetical protein ACXYMO_03950 [Arenibacterium sp. CAU 1754]